VLVICYSILDFFVCSPKQEYLGPLLPECITGNSVYRMQQIGIAHNAMAETKSLANETLLPDAFS
jgi:hypothetical protein